MIYSGKHESVQSDFGIKHIFKMWLNLQNIIRLVSENTENIFFEPLSDKPGSNKLTNHKLFELLVKNEVYIDF